jgi:hypothetical protein
MPRRSAQLVRFARRTGNQQFVKHRTSFASAAGTVAFAGRYLWVDEFKFSGRLLRYSPRE